MARDDQVVFSAGYQGFGQLRHGAMVDSDLQTALVEGSGTRRQIRRRAWRRFSSSRSFRRRCCRGCPRVAFRRRVSGRAYKVPGMDDQGDPSVFEYLDRFTNVVNVIVGVGDQSNLHRRPPFREG